jgi:hypothetical protein
MQENEVGINQAFCAEVTIKCWQCWEGDWDSATTYKIVDRKPILVKD